MLSKELGTCPIIIKRQSCNLIINPYTRIVTDTKGRAIHLTAKEFDLINYPGASTPAIRRPRQ